MTAPSPALNKYLRGSRSKSKGSSGPQSAGNTRESAQMQVMITAATVVSKTKNKADRNVLRNSDRTNAQKGSQRPAGARLSEARNRTTCLPSERELARLVE